MNNFDFIKVIAGICKNNVDRDPYMSDYEKQLRKAGIEYTKEMAKRYYNQNKPIVPVAAALIWDNDKFMICQRPAHKARALLWEFVGGKVEPGEELAVTLSVGDAFMDVVHEYSDIIVHLTLFNATIAEGVPQKLEHNDIQWIAPSEIPNYDFCPADEEILKKITEVYGNG